ncbi:MAG TPA: DUF1801 domain-containing protein [Pseudolysinimonas sp.]|nr:DUF1801 domain-containing protein [Pseudolysinimonas sp.]
MADKDTKNFSDFERQAMKDRAAEVKAQKADKTRAGGQKQIDDAAAKMTPAEQKLLRTIEAIVQQADPELMPKTYYGMPAWTRDGKVLCFFQPATKFKVRYSTLGFEGPANLDDGNFWPSAYAIPGDLTAEDEKRLAAIMAKAVS